MRGIKNAVLGRTGDGTCEDRRHSVHKWNCQVPSILKCKVSERDHRDNLAGQGQADEGDEGIHL